MINPYTLLLIGSIFTFAASLMLATASHHFVLSFLLFRIDNGLLQHHSGEIQE